LNRWAVDDAGKGREAFHTTHWSLVFKAAERGTSQAQRALATLCETYWYPLYAYARRLGADPDEARDQTQAYFASLLEKNYVGDADRQRGRFRTFLITSFRNHRSKERKRAAAAKRGGGQVLLSFDYDDAEHRYRLEPIDHRTPEQVFERRWALTLLDRAVDEVRKQYRSGGKAELFDVLSPLLAGARLDRPYSEIAHALEISEGALKVAAHRLRGRFRDTLRALIAETVAEDVSIEDELRDLMRIVTG